jgi:hypothetical protein
MVRELRTKIKRLYAHIYSGRITSLKQIMNNCEYMQKVVCILHTHPPQSIANVQQNRGMMTYSDLLSFLKNLQLR